MSGDDLANTVLDLIDRDSILDIRFLVIAGDAAVIFHACF